MAGRCWWTGGSFWNLGGFDSDFFALYEDVDLGWRLWLAGHRVVMAPDSVVRHRGHATLETQAPEKTRYLMHRNALLTIFKNYEEENFRKIVPLALLLSVKRAVHFSGVRKESFYLWSETRHKLEEGDAAARSQLLDSLNHLVAVDDVLQSLPRLLEKRRRVQALRRRSDREIMELFGDPLRRIVGGPGVRQGGTGASAVAGVGIVAGSGPERRRSGVSAGVAEGEDPVAGKGVECTPLAGGASGSASSRPAGAGGAVPSHRSAGGVEGCLSAGVRLRQSSGVKDERSGGF